MNNSMLKKVREEYHKIKKEKESLLSYKNELVELCNNEKVQKFLELSGLVDVDYIGPSEGTMVRRAYEAAMFNVKTIDSNHIMVYMGSYIKNDSMKEDKPYMTYERDPETSFKSYMDLETGECYYIEKDKCQEFENEYLTVYLPVFEYTEAEYYKNYCHLQNWFKMQVIHRSQPDVIQEIQNRRKRTDNVHYPSFHAIDTIANFSIEEYVKRFPRERYGEQSYLSSEEYMRVKLYRKQTREKKR